MPRSDFEVVVRIEEESKILIDRLIKILERLEEDPDGKELVKLIREVIKMESDSTHV